MNLYPNPRVSYVTNRHNGRGYVITPDGRCSTVNEDAVDLLTSPDVSWQQEPDYRPFLETAREARWLLPRRAPEMPLNRRIDQAHHLQRIQYELNLLCNLECAHCYCSSSPRAPRGRDLAFVASLVEQAAAMGVIYFDVTGGEPLARKDIFEILALIKAHGMVPGLFTNGTLVTEEVATRLASIGLSSIQTSLDARTPELHDAFRGRRGAFERTVRGIAALRDAGLRVSVTVVAHRGNAHELGALRDFLNEELRVPFRIDRVIPAGRSLDGDAVALSNREFYGLVRSLFGSPEDAPLVKVCDSPTLEAAESGIDPGCGVGASYMFIKHDGRAALCPTLTEAEGGMFVQATLDDASLEEVWLSHPTFTRFRGMQCRNASHCPSGESCRGGCRSNAYLLHGSIDSPDELSCNLHKNGADDYRDFLAVYAGNRSLAPRSKRLSLRVLDA